LGIVVVFLDYHIVVFTIEVNSNSNPNEGARDDEFGSVVEKKRAGEKLPPPATLIRRTVEGAEELGQFEVPEELFMASWEEDGVRAGGTSIHPMTP
jgi:hypothetical protein